MPRPGRPRRRYTRPLRVTQRPVAGSNFCTGEQTCPCWSSQDHPARCRVHGWSGPFNGTSNTAQSVRVTTGRSSTGAMVQADIALSWRHGTALRPACPGCRRFQAKLSRRLSQEPRSARSGRPYGRGLDMKVVRRVTSCSCGTAHDDPENLELALGQDVCERGIGRL